MLRVIKLIFVLGIIGFAALSGYAYLADISPDLRTVSETIELDVN